MLSKPLGLVLLLATCSVAAAGGAYVAARQNAAEIQPAALIATDRSPSPATPVPSPAAAVNLAPAPIRPGDSGDTSVRSAGARLRAPGQTDGARRIPTDMSSSTAPDPPVDGGLPVSQPDGPFVDPGLPAQPNPASEGAGTSALPAMVPPPLAPPLLAEGTPVDETQQAPKPAKVLTELVIPADAVLGLQLETSLSSERAQVEDRVDAKVTRDVRVGDRVAIPAGTRVIGSVVQVGRGGRVKERASLSIRFHTLVLADATRLAINTGAISRESESPASKSAAKIGGAAVGGAVLGAIIGGGRGAAIGGTIGAAGGTTAVMAGDRAAVALPSGTLLTVRMLTSVTVNIEK